MSTATISTPRSTSSPMGNRPSLHSPLNGEDGMQQQQRTRTSGLFPRISFRNKKSSSRGTGRSKNSTGNKLFGLRKSSSSSGASSPRQRASSMNDVMTNASLSFDARMELSKVEQGSSCNNTSSSSSPESYNVMTWLETSCPDDLLPHILAYVGPQKLAILSKTNRHWNAVAKKESTWRVMCEELYKWKPGDKEPYSWAEYYRRNPCVPVDYNSVRDAFQLACAPGRGSTRQVRSVKIWMRPGRHHIAQTLHIRAFPGVQVALETMQMPENVYRAPPRGAACVKENRLVQSAEQAQPTTPIRSSRRFSKRRSSSLANLIRCMRVIPALPAEEPTDRAESENDEGGVGTWEDWSRELEAPPKQATLVLRTRKENEPVFCVRQGQVYLKNMTIEHTSRGLDIWNGNAAIQVQPPLGQDDMPLRLLPRPSCILDHVDVTSRSGRGIVNIDGGHITLKHAAVHDCAATGVYVGGPGSSALLAHSDVVHNGVGNRTAPRRGIARGHSGVYLEQGRACIVECNISENVLTGISAVSPDNAILNMSHTDLVSNGTFQLELPSLGTFARRESILADNHLAPEGAGRMRSGLLPESKMRASRLARRVPEEP